MELEEAENNLTTSEDMYGRDLIGKLDQSDVLPNFIFFYESFELVEKAQELLKNMLKVASERVFETILKIIATEAGISKTSFTSQPVASLQLRPLLAANSFHCSIKYPTRSRFPSRKDEQEQPQSKSPPKKAGPRLSKCSISDKGKAIRKALFNNVGEESSIMQQDLVKAAHLSNEKPLFPIKEISHHEQQYSGSTFHADQHSELSPDTFNSKAGELREVSETSLPYRVCEVESNPSASSSMVEAQDEEEDISSDLFNAIKRIESRILALQLYSSLAYSKKNGSGNKSMHKITNSESPIRQKNEGTAGNRPSYGKFLLEGNGLMNQQENQLACKVENQIVDPEMDNGIITQRRSQKSEACRATMLASRGEKLLCQNGFRPPAQSMAMVDRFHSLNRSVSGKDHSVNQANECIQGIRIPLNSITAGPTYKDKPTRRNPVAHSETHRREKQPLHHVIPRQALPHGRSSELKSPPHGYRNRKVLENRGTHKMRASSPHHHESQEEFSSSSFSPASLTSNQSSAIYSSSKSEDIGDSQGKKFRKTYEYSSGESSSYSQNDDAGSSHRRESSSSGRSWHNRRGPDKTVGRLRRLKNKLRLIFHHHHHLHHHHHHDEDNGKMSKVDHSHSIWQRIVHGKNKHKLLAKRKTEKTRGGTIVEVSHGKQVGKFHGLVEGLLRHVRHSKKRKPSKVVRIKGSRNLKRGNRKNFHWWQMLRRHRG